MHTGADVRPERRQALNHDASLSFAPDDFNVSLDGSVGLLSDRILRSAE